MPTLVVGVADYKISRDPSVKLVTLSLGSCIAVSLHDPVARVGGLLHFMLPDCQDARRDQSFNPAMFADSGIPLLLRDMAALGADRKKLIARLAGGSRILDPEGLFNIGRRNFIAARKMLWEAGILVRGEAVGGTLTRSFGLDVGTGRIWLRQQEAPSQPPQGATGHTLKGFLAE